MKNDASRAWERLEIARRKAEQLEEELRSRPQAGDPEWVRLSRAYSDSVKNVWEAEHSVAKAGDGTPGVTGTHGDYRWLSSVDHDIDDLLRLCPAALLGRRIAVTSIESGPLRLTDEEKIAGWWIAQDRRVYSDLPSGGREERDDWMVACSPVLHSIHGLPNETHDECCEGFDEWFVFDREIPVADFEVFVNWGGFRLYDIERYGEFVDRFWKQMERLNAESYLSIGCVFTFATRNTELFDAVIAAFSADLRSQQAH
jgi:hypothetical protein